MVHPKFLDVKGLVALWREGLLAELEVRDLEAYKNLTGHDVCPAAHPLFRLADGDIREWENVA